MVDLENVVVKKTLQLERVKGRMLQTFNCGELINTAIKDKYNLINFTNSCTRSTRKGAGDSGA